MFDGLSLTIAQRQNVAILGPNGAGKSTLLKLLAREIYPAPRNGSWLKIMGKTHLETRAYQATLGLVSHDLQAIFPTDATALEAVLSGFSVSFGVSGITYRYSIDERLAAEAMLDRFGLGAEKQFVAMSTGQQRRCLLARAMVPGPQHLVLDEPLAGLDPGAAFGLLETFSAMLDEGVSVILATHHVNEILPQVERVVFLKGGQVVADGTPANLLTHANLSDLYDAPLKVDKRHGHWAVSPATPIEKR